MNPWVIGAAGLVAAVASLYLTAFSDPIGELLYLVLFVVLLSLVAVMTLFVPSWRQKRLTIAFAFAMYVLTTLVGLRLFPAYRFHVRWLVSAANYKQEVLKQPTPTNGQLRHIEWDGWGFPGAGDTTVYLVYDPSDLLSGWRSDARVAGLPCEVSSIKRLQPTWYAVVFYTDSDWEHCPP